MNGGGGTFGLRSSLLLLALIGIAVIGVGLSLASWMQMPYYGEVPSDLPKPQYTLATVPRGKELIAQDGKISDPDCPCELLALIDWEDRLAWNGKGEPVPIDSVEDLAKPLLWPGSLTSVIVKPQPMQFRLYLRKESLYEKPLEVGVGSTSGYHTVYSSDKKFRTDLSEIVLSAESHKDRDQLIGYLPFKKEVKFAGATIRTHSLTSVGSELFGQDVNATVSVFGRSKEEGLELTFRKQLSPNPGPNEVNFVFGLTENLDQLPEFDLLSGRGVIPTRITFPDTPYWEVRATPVHTLRFPIKLQPVK